MSNYVAAIFTILVTISKIFVRGSVCLLNKEKIQTSNLVNFRVSQPKPLLSSSFSEQK